MVTWMRRLHLISCAVVLGFLMMYFVTGYLMIHPSWFPAGGSKEQTRSGRIDLDPAATPEAWSRAIQQRFELDGLRVTPRTTEDGRWRLDYRRPAGYHRVLLEPGSGAVEIVSHAAWGSERLVGLHVQHGYGGPWKYSLWSAFYDLASLSLIVFAATGVYLWFRMTRRRLLGWLLLAAGFGHAAATVAWLMWSR